MRNCSHLLLCMVGAKASKNCFWRQSWVWFLYQPGLIILLSRPVFIAVCITVCVRLNMFPVQTWLFSTTGDAYVARWFERKNCCWGASHRDAMKPLVALLAPCTWPWWGLDHVTIERGPSAPPLHPPDFCHVGWLAPIVRGGQPLSRRRVSLAGQGSFITPWMNLKAVRETLKHFRGCSGLPE
jgi:hypothetical protein